MPRGGRGSKDLAAFQDTEAVRHTHTPAKLAILILERVLAEFPAWPVDRLRRVHGRTRVYPHPRNRLVARTPVPSGAPDKSARKVTPWRTRWTQQPRQVLSSAPQR
jgi:hypothetical protein